jgi:hypothetical protein
LMDDSWLDLEAATQPPGNDDTRLAPLPSHPPTRRLTA